MRENVQRQRTAVGVTEALTHYFAVNDQPLSAGNNTGFCCLLTILEPSYEIPRHHHITLPNCLSSSRSSSGNIWVRMWAPRQSNHSPVDTSADFICSGSMWGVNPKPWCFGIRYESCCDRASETLEQRRAKATRRCFTDTEKNPLECVATPR